MNSWGALILGMAIVAAIWGIWTLMRNGNLNTMVGKFLDKRRVFLQDFQADSFTESGVLRVEIGQPYRDPTMAFVRAIMNAPGKASIILYERPLQALVPEDLFQKAANLASLLGDFQVISQLGGLMIRSDSAKEWDPATFEWTMPNLMAQPADPDLKPFLPQPNMVTGTMPFGEAQLFRGDMSITANGVLQMEVKCHRKHQDSAHAFLAGEFTEMKPQRSSDSYLFAGQTPKDVYAKLGEIARETDSEVKFSRKPATA